MRLFAAIDLAVGVADAGLPDRQLRLANVEQWHLTTAFFGEVAEHVVPELTERLELAAGRTPAMTLSLSGAGTFPSDAGAARVLWVGVDGELDVLGRLADRSMAAGRRCGLPMDGGRYQPHLTIGRSRNGPADLNAAAGALAAYQGSEWRATSMQLIRSQLGPEVKHEVQAVFPLA
jgi:2'-5' RNA ligase